MAIFKSRLLEVVQLEDTPDNRAHVLQENPNNDPDKLTIDKLITESDVRAVYDYVQSNEINGAKFMRGVFARQDCDKYKEKVQDGYDTPTVNYLPKKNHFHCDFLFDKEVSVEALSDVFKQVTGKIIPYNCIDGSHDKSNACVEVKFLTMASYTIHAFQPRSGRPAPALGSSSPDFSSGYYFDGQDFQPLSSLPSGTDITDKRVSTAPFDNCKYLYPIDTAVCYNCDMREIIAGYIKHREEESEKASQRQLKTDVASFLHAVAMGEIRPFEVYNACTPEVYIEACDKNKLKHAIQYAFHHMPEGFTANRNLQVIHIQGASGSGKTAMAKALCEKLGLSYCVSTPGLHPFDEYNGHDCLILDDFRDSDIQFSQLLKILDNNTVSDLPARYYNRSTRFLKMIILTSVKPVHTLYKKKAQHDGEEYKQLMRRITTSIRISPADNVARYFTYDETAQNYFKFSHEKAWTFKPEKYFADAPKDAYTIYDISDALDGTFTAPVCDPVATVPVDSDEIAEEILEESLIVQIEQIYPPYNAYIADPIPGLFVPSCASKFVVSPEGRPWIEQ